MKLFLYFSMIDLFAAYVFYPQFREDLSLILKHWIAYPIHLFMLGINFIF